MNTQPLLMKRRDMILRTGLAALGLGLAPGCASWSGRPRTKKVLFFTKSAGFEHSVIKETKGQPSFAAKILSRLGPEHGIEFTFSKDGSLFTPEYLAGFDAFFFYTTGDLTTAGGDHNPAMTPAGKAAFLDAIKAGKGFIGTHAATDTFHSKSAGPGQNGGEIVDPYIQMIGGEFIIHGSQQKARMRVADTKFPGMAERGAGFDLNDEWYSLKNFAPDLHVLLVQETEGMHDGPYKRPAYPATWARRHGKGHVFYTSMGHREDVWENPIFQEILFGGIGWAVGNLRAEVKPNFLQVTPEGATLPAANRR